MFKYVHTYVYVVYAIMCMCICIRIYSKPACEQGCMCDAEGSFMLTLGKTPFFMNMEMEKVGIIHKIAKVDGS